ncbi:MAG: sterol desaturase family protein [Solirubrobacterales bacterium]|nr:sterol desaturase family protein [Solirubrobacterales bacterium]
MIFFLGHLAWFAAVVAAFRALERRWPAGTCSRVRDQAFNFGLVITAALVSICIAQIAPPLSTLLAQAGLIDLFGSVQAPGTALEWVLGSLLYAFIWDFFQYWFHRLQHTLPSLLFVHALHHDTDALNSSDALRNTVWHAALGTLLIAVPILLLGIGSLLHVYGAFLLFSTYGMYNHANIRWSHGPLTRVLSGPQLHRPHHGLVSEYHNTNYAAFFPVLDILFGTYRPPERGEYPSTGLADRPASRGRILSLARASLGLRGPGPGPVAEMKRRRRRARSAGRPERRPTAASR